jgi:hypothetical protein
MQSDEIREEGANTVTAARNELWGKAGEHPLSGSQGHAAVGGRFACLDTPGTFAVRRPAVRSGRRAGHSTLNIKAMEQTIQMTGGELAAVHARRQAVPIIKETGTMGKYDFKPPLSAPDLGPDLFTREAVLTVPPRGGEPKPIGQLMEPIQRIIKHPNRNRLMAELCKRHW